ncbi:glycosyltransferase family 1 protein [Agromyces sp. NPDC049794]|uniref:glycosyltransferase family 4 protein n=1 Tax=unclassified Agromyces TaxID=2639701 RepID=UPI0033C693BD
MSKVPHVLTLHDLIHLNSRGTEGMRYRAYYEFVVRPAIKRAGVVLTVSETSRSALIEWLGDESIEVVNAGNGVNEHFKPGGPNQLSDAEPYLLYVGAVRPHKNLGVVIDALTKVPGLTLRAVGPDVNRVRDLASRAGLSDRVSAYSGLDDSELAVLYRGAKATVMPSVIEGFGLPAAESISCGTPVIYFTGCRSVAEIVGGSGISVDEGMDPDAWAVALRATRDGSVPTVRPLARSDYEWEGVADKVGDVLSRFG